jgi:hypothetical protein
MSITRSEVIRRAATIWPLNQVPYSMSGVRNPGWRTDCSGYVSMCLNLTDTKPGATTVTLVTGGYIHEIESDKLKPGDLVGHCGPGTAFAAGHVIVFDRWAQDHTTYWAYELHGPDGLKGPEHSLIHYPYNGLDGYKAYRYREIAHGSDGNGGPGHGGHWVSVQEWPDPQSTISGIAAHFSITDWHMVWDDPKNAGLRALRMVPEHIQPGDAVWVPAP